MRINADFSSSALVRRGDAQWHPSPMAGVERLMFERIGDEVARATSLVRYAPHSRFDSHVHDKGEEFLVLKGTFSDALGDYGPGTYVRNPPGTAHAPWSEEGCTIFVKLRQFDDADRARVVIDSTSSQAQWRRAAPGVNRLALHQFGEEVVSIFHFEKSATIDLSSSGGLEVFVLAGVVDADGTRLGTWDWMRLPRSLSASLKGAADDTRAYVKSGHLRAAENLAKSAT